MSRSYVHPPFEIVFDYMDNAEAPLTPQDLIRGALHERKAVKPARKDRSAIKAARKQRKRKA